MRYLTLIPLFLLILASPLQAIEPRQLYHAEVEVPDQGGQARTTGMEQAMAEVLVKVAGTRRVHEDETLATAMRSASRYVQQYRYRSEPQSAAGQQEGRAAKERLLLSVRFDPKSIDELLQRQGFTVWGAMRPSTLIWLGVEQGNKRLLLGANDGGFVHERIEQEAARRALPVKLPLLDLADQSRVRPADIWGGFVETIEEASVRYAPQAILIGRLDKVTSSRWEARWILLYGEERLRWRQQAAEVAELIEEGIGQTAEHLLERFSSTLVSGSGNMRLEVLGIADLKQYRQVADYLSGVHGVSAVRAERVTHEAVRFNLQIRGGSAAILQMLALGDLLEVVPVREKIPVAEEVPVPPGAVRGGQATEPVAEPVTEQADSVVTQPPATIYRLVP
ncbi:MAG: DUF2066 domain-containing protein [Gammaproteobacteria bacterium]|nr:DUF2066 domain-containing protein [Gammaproteobacteria bacterium]MCW8839926.1 DUF2066 domain-containing protein [Gammaproteobacteria bacterium]MCW8957928.1 DUF2066 domain-containing protein [Gammaproteobacteria bacterium]MCW8973715.1 DUF2066 domain-containing protein [Gammaproteobacteria bacterium]MCW8993296.1 DUF2066 domain-containing protein [Gammaproteobacteria bacterium]